METSLSELRTWMKPDQIADTSSPRLHSHLKNCTALNRQVTAVIYPANRDEIQRLVHWATKNKVSLYPVSCGHNWGYGSSLPFADNCIIVDLSKMNAIVAFDQVTGTVTLQPGVTQIDLYDFLKSHRYPFLVPTTGAGPQTSIVGNALERGFGLVPHCDHFSAIMSVESILPDGSLYRPFFAELGAERLSRAFKYSVGPYLDGLFCQNNIGIVTQMTIALAPRPEGFMAFFFSVSGEDRFDEISEAVSRLLRALPGLLGGINLMNNRRVLSMIEENPTENRQQGLPLSHALVKQLQKKNDIGEWTGVGTLFGHPQLLAAAKDIVEEVLGELTSRLVFVSKGRIKLYRRMLSALTFNRSTRLSLFLKNMDRSLSILSGLPDDMALNLVNWRSKRPQSAPADPDESDVGLIWYAPVLPIVPETPKEFTAMVESVCLEHQIDPLITFTAFNERCYDCTIPILFSREDDRQVEQAHACYQKLVAEGLRLGAVPYRFGLPGMDTFRKFAKDSVYWSTSAKIKKALDPNNIIAPGRYQFL